MAGDWGCPPDIVHTPFLVRKGAGGWSEAKLPAPDEPLILIMGTYPEPDQHITLADAEGTITQANTDGIDWPGRVDLLEPEAMVLGVALEKAVSLSGLALDMLWQFRERLAETRRDMGGHRTLGSIWLVRP